MNLTEHMSIGGYAFTMEKDAAAAAESYINQMSAIYGNKEITDGIEERMAELLLERVPKGAVADKAAIDSVIEILGRPESIAADQPEEETSDIKPRRKLYRDMDNAKIGGVCSGLAAYFKTDSAIFRIGFTLLTLVCFLTLADKSFFAACCFPIAYLILWICIPAAKTAQQRWALKGEDGTAEGVRRSVERSDAGAALHDVANSPAWGTIGRVLAVIAGLFLLVVSVSGLFAGALAIFGWQWLGLGTVLSDALLEITREFPQSAIITQTLWVKILAVTVYVLPFIGMLYASIMLLFNLRSPSWHPGLVIFVVWLIALVALGVLIVACAISASAL